MTDPLFVDSWGWIVLSNQNDPAFRQVQKAYGIVREEGRKIVTTDYVLDEVITFLFAKAASGPASKYLNGLFQAAERGLIQIERIDADHFQKSWRLRQKYHDRPRISFTDFTSFMVMQELRITDVLTHDHHFEEVNLGFRRLPNL